MVSYKEALKSLEKQLSSFEAAQLFHAVTNVKTWEIPLKPESFLTKTQEVELKKLVKKRLSGEPLQYLLGEWEFYGYPFYVGEGVLIPRPDSEILVETALQLLKNKDNPKVLDLCAGSGAIGIAIEKEIGGEVLCLEYSKDAFSYLVKNIERNNSSVKAVLGDIHIYTHPEKVDLIVSNPPYIPREDLESLQIEVKKEPIMALDGGNDGLDFYRRITHRFYPQLKTDGYLAFEVGLGQHQDVGRIMDKQGFADITFQKDLGDIHRVVYGRKEGKQ